MTLKIITLVVHKDAGVGSAFLEDKVAVDFPSVRDLTNLQLHVKCCLHFWEELTLLQI